MMMTDREKVISGLECCLKDGPESCPECPYCADLDKDSFWETEWHCREMKLGALELLKAQEPRTVAGKFTHMGIFVRATCPWCNCMIDEHFDSYYCGICGKPVKWYEAD